MGLESNKYYLAALEYIKGNDLSKLNKGRNDIDGDNLYVNIIETTLKTPQEAKFEAHDQYIDIQVPISCGESYGVKARELCTMPVGEMNVEQDYILFDDAVEEIVSREAGEMIVFEPDTAHAPCIGSGPIKKAVFKVKVV